MKIKKQAKSRTVKNLTIVAVVALLSLMGYLVVAKYSNLWPFTLASTETGLTNTPATSIDHSPPTDEYLAENEAKKAERLKEAEERREEDEANASSTAKKKADLSVSFAGIYEGNLEVRAFVTNVIEGTGICTVTASRDGYSPVTASKPAFVDATSSICQPIFIAKNKLSSGTWDIVVSYSSPKYEAITNQIKVEVK